MCTEYGGQDALMAEEMVSCIIANGCMASIRSMDPPMKKSPHIVVDVVEEISQDHGLPA